MLTKHDLENIRLIVKEEVKKEVKDQLLPLRFEIQEIKTDFKRDLITVKDDILSFKVEVVGELQNLRDDLRISTFGYGDRLEEHHERLSKVEGKLGIVPD